MKTAIKTTVKTVITYFNLVIIVAAILFWFYDSAKKERIEQNRVIRENRLSKDIQKKEFEYKSQREKAQDQREKEMIHRIERLEFMLLPNE
jgi:uncharacterized membrane protein (DUF106 family)